MKNFFRKTVLLILILSVSLFVPYKEILAFCGFYVAKADATLYNNASRVVLVRNEDKTVISMMNDYKGALKDFAIVVPVPVVLQKEQIHVGNPKTVDHIDAYSAPRLVEYFDSDPCRRMYDEAEDVKIVPSPSAGNNKDPFKGGKTDHGVTVEATYTVGEYDIQILSAKYSSGLETWLVQNGYKIPQGASKALKPYIQQNLKFFVAKVNLKEHASAKLTYLRPLQFAFNSRQFMLPIRLGMINAQGPQDLLIYVLTKNGRVESSNYRTVKLPTDMEVPSFVKKEFSDFYKSMFDNQTKKENLRAVFTEYFWNMGWCDPCAAEPLSFQELKELGVFWLDEKNSYGGAVPVMVTRLHVRYSNETFPEDLVFQETNDQQNFQGRYIIQHPWTGNRNDCRAAETYFQELEKREDQRAKNLASLTGWDLSSIYKKMNRQSYGNTKSGDGEKWWKKIWK